MSGVTFESFYSPVQISTHGTFLCHIFTAASLISSFTTDFRISAAAKFGTSLPTCLFIYSKLLRKVRGTKRKEHNTGEEYMMSCTNFFTHNIIGDQIKKD